MIEITERQALALSKAVEILTDLGWTNPEVWVRGIDPFGESAGIDRIGIIFWIKRDPHHLTRVNVDMCKTENGWKPIVAFGHVPSPNSIDLVEQQNSVWDFDNLGNPKKR
jgi:hypothetical protein